MQSYQQTKRRKKRVLQAQMTKTVTVVRGKFGYGFTISGQNPCMLSCIVPGSPAHAAGLKAGDLLYFVNGLNVSQASHDEVVGMVGVSTGSLDLQVAENYNSSDSSDDDYLPRTKSRYPNRVRPRQSLGERGASQEKTSSSWSTVKQNSCESLKQYHPPEEESDLSSSLTSQEDQAWLNPAVIAWQGFCRTRPEKAVLGAGTKKQRDEIAHVNMCNQPIVSTAKKISSAAAVVKRVPPVIDSIKHIQQGILKQRISENVQADISSKPDPSSVVMQGSSEENERSNKHTKVNDNAQAIVGYIGSIETPNSHRHPHQRLHALRNAVKRLRLEKRVHTLVLMEVKPSGVLLTNAMGKHLALYPSDRIVFSGICSDDERFFGLVTQSVPDQDDNSFQEGEGCSVRSNSTCHIFMIDPDISSHSSHVQHAQAFHVHCGAISQSGQCPHFPRSATSLAFCIASLYRDKPSRKFDSDIVQSQAFADPVTGSQHCSSTSDVGLGSGSEEVPLEQNQQVCVVDLTGGRELLDTSGMSSVMNASLISMQNHLSPEMDVGGAAGTSSPCLSNSNSSEECWQQILKPMNKLTPQAMPRPACVEVCKTNASEFGPAVKDAEHLKQNMQRFLQARQQLLEEQNRMLGSDGESYFGEHVLSLSMSEDGHAILEGGSNGYWQPTSVFAVPKNPAPVSIHHVRGRSAFHMLRPLSAPLGKHSKPETVDLDAVRKLSPCVFPHRTPSSSIFSRSPSAPPAPFFPHRDSDDEEDEESDGENDPYIRQILEQFDKDRMAAMNDDSRRYSEGFAMPKKKDTAASASVEKWTKTGSFRRGDIAALRQSFSQSLENSGSSLTMSSRGVVLTCTGNHVGSKCQCQDSLVPLISETKTVGIGNSSVRTMSQALLRLAKSGARRPDCSSKSTISTLTKSVSDSLKIRKKRKSYVQSDLLQRNATCEGGDFNELNKPVSCFSHSMFGRAGRHASSIVSRRRSGSDVAFRKDSTRNVDMGARGVHTTDLAVDDGTPSKHRRISLTVGSTLELHPDEFENSQQHSSMWHTPLDVSQTKEINQPGLYRRSCSQSYIHSSKMTRVLPCAAPASQHKTTFTASRQLLNQTVDLHDLSHRRSSVSSRHRKSQIIDRYIQHRRRRQDSSSYHSQTFDLPNPSNNKSFDLSNHNQTFDVSQCHNQQAFDLSKQSLNQAVDSTQCSYRRCKSSEWTYESSFCDRTVPSSCDSFNSFSVTVDTLNQTTDSACLSGYISANMTLPVGENGGNTATHKMMTACSVHNIAAADPQSQQNVTKAGRVASWAVQFDKLLHDPLAVKVFTEFLEKEFSAENIRFWQACEQFRSVTNEQQRKALAKDIYSRHLATRASEPVNVDGTARAYTERFVDTPTAIMFDVPQNQILHLMRQDSYPRFLKSDLYKNMLLEELQGNIHHEPEQTTHSKGDKKQNSGKENNSKKRRSILPWKSLKSTKGTSEGEQKKLSKKGREGSNNQVAVPGQGSTSTAVTTGSSSNKNNNNLNNNMANIKKYTGLNIDLSIMRKEVFQQEEVVGGRETQVKFCRVILPDGSTTVVCAKPGQTCRSVLSKLCEKRSISISNVDVFLLGSDKSVDLNEDISTLGSKEIVIERRVLFRLDLPDGKSVGAKAKPNRSIRDVLKPILTKYGYNLENINMNVTSCPEVISMEMQVTKLDNQRLVLTLEPETTGLQKHKGPLFGLFRASEKRVVERKHQGQVDIYKD